MRELGIYYDLSNADYHGDRTAVGCTGLKTILEAPACYFGRYLDPNCPPEPERETAGRRFGTLVHAYLFEHERFNERYAVGPAVSSRALKAWKDFCASLPMGVEAITPAEYDCLQQVRMQARDIPDFAKALTSGHGEVSAYAVDEATGVRVKVRPDWVEDVGSDAVILWDGKTYASADENEFVRQAARMKYAMQAGLYSDFYAKASGKKVLAFVFLLVADDYPNLTNAVMLDDNSMAAGRRQYRRALDTYAECMRTGVWPGYGNDVKTVSLPAWALEE
jgi:exodeoxyribonuclease VIII